jgi:predicted DNA-binding transcriptional regulator YafY
LRLARLLHAERAMPANQLAKLLGCCKRTIYRDLSLLRESGLVVQFDSTHGGYVTRTGLADLDCELTKDELAILAVAALTSPMANLTGYMTSIRKTILKLGVDRTGCLSSFDRSPDDSA